MAYFNPLCAMFPDCSSAFRSIWLLWLLLLLGNELHFSLHFGLLLLLLLLLLLSVGRFHFYFGFPPFFLNANLWACVAIWLPLGNFSAHQNTEHTENTQQHSHRNWNRNRNTTRNRKCSKRNKKWSKLHIYESVNCLYFYAFGIWVLLLLLLSQNFPTYYLRACSLIVAVVFSCCSNCTVTIFIAVSDQNMLYISLLS